MKINRTNVVLGAALAASLALNWGLRSDDTTRSLEFAPDMAHSARYNAFAPNPNFGDGKTLRAPEPGTIPRGLPPLEYGTTPDEAERAGAELRNPVVPDEAALARGAANFANFCRPCHGATGLGDGPVAKRGFPPPPSLVTDFARGLPDGQLFHIITYGQASMPPHGSQLSREDRWKTILHVRALQQAAAGSGVAQ